MRIREVNLRPAKNGFIVSYWQSPEPPKGGKSDMCGMGEHIDEVFEDETKAANRMMELAKDTTAGANPSDGEESSD